MIESNEVPPTLMVVNFDKLIKIILYDNYESYHKIKHVENILNNKTNKSEIQEDSILIEKPAKDDKRNNKNRKKTNQSPSTKNEINTPNNKSTITNENTNNKTTPPNNHSTPVDNSITPNNISTPNGTSTPVDNAITHNNTSIPNGIPTPNNKSTPIINKRAGFKVNNSESIPSKTIDRNHSFINIIKNIIISMSEIYKQIKVDVSINTTSLIPKIKSNFTTLSALYGQIFEKTLFYDPEALDDVDFLFWRVFSMNKRLSKVDLSNISIGKPLRNSFQHHNYVYDKDSFQLYYEFLEFYFLSEKTCHQFKNIEESYVDQKTPKDFKVMVFNLNNSNGYYYIDYIREENLLELCRYFMAYSHSLYAVLTQQLHNIPLPASLLELFVKKYRIPDGTVETKYVSSHDIKIEIEKKSGDYKNLTKTERLRIFSLVEKEFKATTDSTTEKFIGTPIKPGPNQYPNSPPQSPVGHRNVAAMIKDQTALIFQDGKTPNPIPTQTTTATNQTTTATTTKTKATTATSTTTTSTTTTSSKATIKANQTTNNNQKQNQQNRKNQNNPTISSNPTN